MNRNRKLSEKTYGKRHVQPHQSRMYATKKKKAIQGKRFEAEARKDLAERPIKENNHDTETAN